MSLIKLIFIILGSLSLIVGIVGIVVPGLPTTPFLLITAGLYVRSSDRLYNKLTSNKYIGRHISEYRQNRGLTRRTKVISIITMWLMIILSCTFFIQDLATQIIVIFLGITGTIVMGLILPTANDSDSNEHKAN